MTRGKKHGVRPVKGKILKLYHNTIDGYFSIKLLNEYGDRKTYHVHRFVAETFIPNPDNLPCVNHKDENKLNNRIDNLEWCTHKYNTNYGTCVERQSLNSTKWAVKCIETDTIYKSVKEASTKTGIKTNTIYHACAQSRKGYGNYSKNANCKYYHWEYVNKNN